MIEKAILFATEAHQGQTRKGSDIPYILHPLEAGIIAAGMLGSLGKMDERIVCAAILHDTFEDTHLTYDKVKEEFGQEVADLVAAQSEDKSRTWKERKQHTIDCLSGEKNQAIKIIALCDKLANIRAMSRDYDRLGEALWDRFNEKNKSEHKWYYSCLAEALRDLEEFEAYHEYQRLVIRVFGF